MPFSWWSASDPTWQNSSAISGQTPIVSCHGHAKATPERRSFAYLLNVARRITCAALKLLIKYTLWTQTQILMWILYLEYSSIPVSPNSAELFVVGERPERRDQNGEWVFEQEAKTGQGLWRGPGSERRSPGRVAEDGSSFVPSLSPNQFSLASLK